MSRVFQDDQGIQLEKDLFGAQCNMWFEVAPDKFVPCFDDENWSNAERSFAELPFMTNTFEQISQYNLTDVTDKYPRG